VRKFISLRESEEPQNVSCPHLEDPVLVIIRDIRTSGKADAAGPMIGGKRKREGESQA